MKPLRQWEGKPEVLRSEEEDEAFFRVCQCRSQKKKRKGAPTSKHKKGQRTRVPTPLE
ncbi:exportin-2 [Pyrus ussuriensis x Pyrus communis]|uniref:Exportin-2 n=1 Tax=Pyrus ussuriensis x Pyrus communis TaxID=2448454 RepID=A0A5N5F7A7_9ROSA|nr:exportin-2 [Pyrus ussuriensis x Pyrus communis]